MLKSTEFRQRRKKKKIDEQQLLQHQFISSCPLLFNLANVAVAMSEFLEKKAAVTQSTYDNETETESKKDPISTRSSKNKGQAPRKNVQ